MEKFDATCPHFSIVIPCYNRSAVVAKAIISVASQSYQNFECIVVDDGSIDSLLLKNLINEYDDHRFRYIWQENGGGGSARNLGIDASRGNWICLLDSDDEFLPGKLEELSKCIQESPHVDFWGHYAKMDRGDGIYKVRPTRPPFEGEKFEDMMFKHREFIQTSTLTIRASVAKEVKFDPSLKKAQDVDFVIRLQRYGALFGFLDGVYSVWHDPPSDNRVGSVKKPQNVIDWYTKQKPYFAKDTRLAFEATYLSYEISSTRKLLPIFYILRAYLFRSIGVKMFISSMLRSFLTPNLYRKLVNSYFKFSK